MDSGSSVDSGPEQRDAALLRGISKLIDDKLEDFKADITSKTDESLEQIRSLKYSERRVFKGRGNQKQYEHNEKVLDCVSAATSCLEKKQFAAAKEYLDKGTSFINNRQKLILIADSERLGWRVAEEYERTDYCIDDEDQKKLWRATQRAEKRCREEEKEKIQKKRRLSSTLVTLQSDQLHSPVKESSGGSPLSTLVPVRVQGVQGRDKSKDTCHLCGAVGHWKPDCPVLKRLSNAVQPGQN